MGIFLIFAIALVIAILFTVFACVATEEKAYYVQYEQDATIIWQTNKKYTLKSKFWKFWYDVNSCGIPCILSVVNIVIFALTCIGLSIGAIATRVNQNVHYQQMYQQYIVLTERLEQDKSEYHLFYEDIMEYNNAILEDRYWSDNLWVNWYQNGKIKDLPLIGENTDNV